MLRRRLRPRAGRGAVLVLMMTLVMVECLRMMLVLGPPSVVDLIRYHARDRVPRAARGVVGLVAALRVRCVHRGLYGSVETSRGRYTAGEARSPDGTWE